MSVANRIAVKKWTSIGIPFCLVTHPLCFLYSPSLPTIVLGDSVPAIKCDPIDPTECNEKEQKYITKVKEWTIEKQKTEVGRVRSVLQTPMSDDLRDWGRRRVNILQSLIKANKQEAEL